jgi:predicted DNA binding CopG/RHH family protein
MDEKRLTVDIPEELHRRLKIRCVELGLEIKEMIRQLIEEYLVKAEKRPKRK